MLWHLIGLLVAGAVVPNSATLCAALTIVATKILGLTAESQAQEPQAPHSPQPLYLCLSARISACVSVCVQGERLLPVPGEQT